MYPVLFTIGSVNFYSYGLMASLAFLATLAITMKFAKDQNIYNEKILDKLLIMFLAGLIGARISYFIMYYNQFTNWYDVFIPWQGALISYGGIIGVIIAAFVIFKKETFKWLDMIAVGFMLGLFFWRMGCFLAGDHPQIASSAFYAIKGEFPAILIESISGLVGFILFYNIYPKLKANYGLIFFLVILFYGVIRVFVDNFRVDAIYFGLRSGQIVGIILAIIGAVGIIALDIKKKRRKHDR